MCAKLQLNIHFRIILSANHFHWQFLRFRIKKLNMFGFAPLRTLVIFI